MLQNDNVKTFFLFPQKLIFEDIAEVLVSQQNEAFVLNNHVHFKEALKIFNRKSLAFINIDSVLSEQEWIEYVRSIRNDPDFSDVKIGIISFNKDQRLIDIYRNELKVECGYHILTSKNKKYEDDITKQVNEMRSRNGLKMLKLDFGISDPVRFSIEEKSINIQGRVDSLSSAAMSITVANDKVLKKGMELNNITLNYNNLTCKLVGTVIGNAQLNKKQFVIKFNSIFEDFHRKPLFKIFFQYLDNQLKELIR